MRAAAVVAAVALVMLGGVARAQNADVPAWIKVIDTQPADMDRTTWKERRRDAAKKLAQSKDKRALPVLVKLAETETFDIIGEIAIEGLGTLGDPGAVPALQKIAADNSRDKTQRDLAKKALAKLGAPETAPKQEGPRTSGLGPRESSGSTQPEPPPPPEAPGPKPEAPPATGTSLLGARPASELPELPVVEDDTLAAYERVTFAAGNASFAYDTLQKRLDFDADFAGAFAKRVERENMAWGVTATAAFAPSLVNQSTIPESMGAHSQQRGVRWNAGGTAEARFYSGTLYGVGKAAVGTALVYGSDTGTDGGGNDFSHKITSKQGDLEVAIGGGYGRLLDIGGAIRVRRIARTLEANRALGKPIDAATAKKLQLVWWALRGERSSYRALLATVAVLREAGILLAEPDAGLAYELLAALRDTWLYVRPSGLDLQIAFGEGYLYRSTEVDGMETYPTFAEQGRVEQLLASAGYGAQLDDDKLELSGSGYARLRLFNSDPQGAPWAVGASASLRRFSYGDHGDPFGLFDVTGDVGLSDDDLPMSKKSLHLGGELGFTYWLNPASGVRLAATAAEDGGAFFLGARLTATYGLLDGTFAR